MLSLSELKRIYNGIKQADKVPEGDFQMLSEFFSAKFNETSSIFCKLDNEALSQFCLNSVYDVFEENAEIFKKGENCNSYYFLLYGDINLYDEEFSQSNTNTNNKLLKTMSAGSVYGHKIKSNFNYYAVAKNLVHFIKIQKSTFDDMIEKTNKRKEDFKTIFLKKFFPKFRMYSEDIVKSLKGYFIREQYEKNAKVIVDHEYDEYVYLIIKGTFGITKSVKRIKNLKDNLQEVNFPSCEKVRYVILEHLGRGDVFGVYSALKHQKNNHTVVVLSDKAEVYKISKSHCLYYFGGSGGIIPEALKGLDSVLQVSLSHKIDFLEKTKKISVFEQFEYVYGDHLDTNSANKKVIDESEIENGIKDAWKELENLGSKISEFKMNLLKSSNTNKATAGTDVFAKMKTQEKEVEMKDHTKLMGFGTNRVVGKTLNRAGLSASQAKGMNTLQNICGVKKTDEKVDEKMLQKISSLKSSEAPKKNKLFFDLDEDLAVKKVNEANLTNSSNIGSVDGVNNTGTGNKFSKEEVKVNDSENKNPAEPTQKKKPVSLRNLIV